MEGRSVFNSFRNSPEAGSRKLVNNDYKKQCQEREAQDYFGCFNMSYIVSAPLHRESYSDFWGHASMMGRFFVFTDLFLHVGLWIVILVMDCWVYNHDQLGTGAVAATTDASGNVVAAVHGTGSNMFMRELHNGVFVSTVLVWVGLILALVYGALGQPAGKAFPHQVALVLGGGFASLLLSLAYVILLAGWTDVMDTTNANDSKVTLRQISIWVVALKAFAFYYAKANIDFHGACEHKEMLKNICWFVNQN